MNEAPSLTPSPRQRETGALNALVAAHRPAARSLARAVLGDADAAEDVAQDAMVRLVAAWPGFAPDTDLKGWVYRVTLNRCRDHLRRTRRRAGDVPMDQAPDHPGLATNPAHERALDLEAAHHAVHAAMARLPTAQQEVLHMRYVEGLPFVDIAKLTATAQGTVASRVFRALKQLAAHLDRRHLEVLE